MWSIRKPSEAQLRAFLAAQSPLPFSYAEVGATQRECPAGYTLDHYRIALGKGRDVFEAACQALRRWQMFPRPWTEIFPADAPLQTGSVVAVLARFFGCWWLNACRVVHVLDETQPTRRFGFAYGTLPGHAESGEECFAIAWDNDDTVWYEVRAVSRPRYWLAQLAYPLARRMQRRFARDSQAAMHAAVTQAVRPGARLHA
jgi:uncharacterized protein (UPF0548 family)